MLCKLSTLTVLDCKISENEKNDVVDSVKVEPSISLIVDLSSGEHNTPPKPRKPIDQSSGEPTSFPK